MSDPWREPTAQRWVQHILSDMAPKLRSSAIAVSLFPDTDEDTPGDVRYWVELGASICMNKPILLVVMGDGKIPAKLELVADEIIRLPDGVNEDAADVLGAAIKRLTDG